VDLLQDVAAGSGQDRCEQVLVIRERREHQHLRLGSLGSDLARRLDAAAVRQPDVHHDRVRLRSVRLDDRLVTERQREIGLKKAVGALNVLQNVMLPLRYTKANVPDGRAWAVELVEMVVLEERISHRPEELSGGEQQRVAIARALINRPALVLGNEPTGSVDTQTALELVGVMQRMNRDEGVTFLIATHDLDLANRCSRMIRLSDGEVISD
jgi:predicted ABC-type transport system involved in lysophospholipase L1 biosynthesis ATPase subunit